MEQNLKSSKQGLNPNIAVFGEVLADVFPDQSVLGGAPFNVARHLQAFGMQAVMISRIGLDPIGDSLMDEMLRLEMETSGMQFDPHYPTGQVRVHIEANGHRFEILPDQAYDHINMAITHETLLSVRPTLAYFGTLALRSMESRLAAEQFLQDSHCQRFLDINLRAPWYTKEVLTFSLTQADIVKMNDEELQTVSAIFNLKGTPQQQAISLKQQFNLTQLLVTCGASGSWLLDQHQQLVLAEPMQPPPNIVDTVGAGDAYCAVFMLGLVNEWDAQTTLQRATAFAAAMCSIRGAAVSGDFYTPFKSAWNIS